MFNGLRLNADVGREITRSCQDAIHVEVHLPGGLVANAHEVMPLGNTWIERGHKA
jgi:hypothetical protein